AAVRARRRRRRAGGARRPAGRGVPGARVQRPRRGSRGPLHRDHGRARAMSALAAWLDRASDWLSPIVVKEVRQIVRGREFIYSFGGSLVAGLAIAFTGAADALRGNG